ncbi:hypothetical protein P8605_07030 [Streptomyces sp. T-3]|nr:hypothetical protein [Streptomyces sp. T-3]
MGIRINTSKVQATSADTDALARTAMKKMAHSLDASEEVDMNHYGWESAMQLGFCARDWEEKMVSLAKRMGALSERLKESAGSYGATEAEAETRLRDGLRDLGGA